MHPHVPQNIRQLRRLLKDIPVGMLTTQTPEGETRSRPMLVHEVDDDGWLWLLTDRSSRKACELIHNPSASLSFQSARGDRYLSIQGMAVVVRDDLKVKGLWNASYRAWFPKGKDDPELALVAVRITRAEYWLVPRHRIKRMLNAAKATVTGSRQEEQHGVLDLHTLPA